jgi:hypothetical protein
MNESSAGRLNPCALVRGDLGTVLDAELEEAQRGVIEGHLATCAECRAELALLKGIVQAVRRAPRAEPEPSLRRRLLAQVAAEADWHRVEVMGWERDGESYVQRREFGATGERASWPEPDFPWESVLRMVIRCRWQEAGDSTMLHQVVRMD